MEHLKLAMDECEKLGVDDARKRYGFTRAKNVHVYHNGRGPFEARVLIAMAYSKLYPDAKKLVPADFTNDNAHRFLAKEFNFDIVSINTGERKAQTQMESPRDLFATG